jgi:hypothetical protein
MSVSYIIDVQDIVKLSNGNWGITYEKQGISHIFEGKFEIQAEIEEYCNDGSPNVMTLYIVREE